MMGRKNSMEKTIQSNLWETEEVKSLVGDNCEYYSKKLTEIYYNGMPVSWNCAAFMGGFWCFYRKMYTLGTAVVLLDLIFTGLHSVYPFHIFYFLRFSVYLLMGLFGNWFYMKRILRIKGNIDKEKKRSIRTRIQKKLGGTTTIAPLVLLGVIIALKILMILFVILCR